MTTKREHTFIIETIEAGQRRKYGDSYYHYIVESTLPVAMIKKYCTEVLRTAISQKQYKEEHELSFDNHFRSYYTKLDTLEEVDFLEDGLNKVEYKVVGPSTH